MDTKERTKQPARRRTRPAAPGTRRSTPARTAPETKRRAQAGAAPRQKPQPTPRVSPDVVYLPPQPFNRNRLILNLATMAAVVLALVLGVSVFFKVENVCVSGNVKYTAWDIRQASGIRQGENLLTFSIPRTSGKIISALPYVEEVRIGIKLPNTVNIEIVEVEVTYAAREKDGGWWLLSAGGKVVEKAESGAEEGYTRILGVELQSPAVGAQAVAAEAQPQVDGEGNQIPVAVPQARRLQTALDIAELLELNGVIGKAASIDVTDMGNICLWYGKRYRVELGDDTQLSYKLACMVSAVEKMDDYQTGVLDISFTTWPNKVGFTPFE